MLASIWSSIVAAKSSIITGFAVAAICLPLGYCEGSRNAKKRAAAERAIANIEALETDGRARELNAHEAITDAATVAKIKEELTDAVAHLPDTMPDVRRVARACVKLRRQGTDTSAIPACQRFEGAASSATAD